MEFYEVKHELTKENIEKYNFKNPRYGVIVYIEDKDKKILLQQRGAKARDENFLYESVGGGLEKTDSDFRSAIIREMKEEMGDKVNIKLDNSNFIYHLQKKDSEWVFIVFKGKYIDGKIDIVEPEKCLGYKFFPYDEAINSEQVSSDCRYLIKSINSEGKIQET